VGFGALLIAYLLGLIPTDEVFAGFGHPAVIIIALVLIISRGLYLSGAIEMMAGGGHRDPDDFARLAAINHYASQRPCPFRCRTHRVECLLRCEDHPHE